MRVLGIETSCDETAAAVVEDGRTVCSTVVASQTELHAPYGGVVPELAARRHVERIHPVVEEAVSRAGRWEAVDGVAVTRGPGLLVALLVGLQAAKGIALARKLPLVGVHHLAGHVASVFIEGATREPDGLGGPVPPRFPFVAAGGVEGARGLGADVPPSPSNDVPQWAWMFDSIGRTDRSVLRTRRDRRTPAR